MSSKFVRMLTSLRNLNQCRLELTQPHNFERIERDSEQEDGTAAAPNSSSMLPFAGAAVGGGSSTTVAPASVGGASSPSVRRLTRLRQCRSSRDLSAIMTSVPASAGDAVSLEAASIAALFAGTALLASPLDDDAIDETLSCLGSLRPLVESLEMFSSAIADGFGHMLSALALHGGNEDVKVGGHLKRVDGGLTACS
jgi:hypothetical protein